MDTVSGQGTSSSGGGWRALLGTLFNGAASVLDRLIRGLITARTTLLYFKLRYADFRPRADDIFIATYPRSGTTWMQMILYQMTSDGVMGFQHISEVCPWFERNIVAGRDLEALPSPRIFKTHLRPGLLPGRPCRHICVVRDGRDVAVSLYHFYRSHFGYQDDFDSFFNMFLAGNVESGLWFDHVSKWWAQRHQPNVMLLQYGDLLNDLEGSIRRIAAFTGITLTEDQMPRILERCSFSYMKQHESLFDHANEVAWEARVQESAFIRQGQTGEGVKKLNQDQNARFNQIINKFWPEYENEMAESAKNETRNSKYDKKK